MNRGMRWVVGTGLVVIIVALVLGLGVVARRVAALSRAGCPMSSAVASIDENCDCPTTGRIAQEPGTATTTGEGALDSPAGTPTPTDLELLQNPELSIPPGRKFSCH